jgi:hypothetical protein
MNSGCMLEKKRMEWKGKGKIHTFHMIHFIIRTLNEIQGEEKAY